MWSWLEDILGVPNRNIGRGDAVDRLLGSGIASAFNNQIQSPFLRNLPSGPPPIQPSIGSNFYDEGSKFREARDQANKLKNPGMPSMADIMARLEALQDPSRYQADNASLMAQARSAASAQYDPVIAQLRSQMGSTESRGNRQREELGQMFGQLSSSLQADIPAIQENYARTKEQTGNEYDQLKQSIAGQYEQSQQEQEAMLQRLNIEAAAPEILPEQQRDRDYFTNLASKEGQTAQTALGMEERGNTEYTRRGSEVARIEGTQRQADLMNQVRDMLDALQGQVGANEAAKSQAISSSLMSLQGQAQNQAKDSAQRDFDNYLKSISLGRDLWKDQQSQLGKPVTSVSSPADVGGRALGMGLPQSAAQQLQDVFMSSIGSDPRILAGLNTDTGSALSKEQLAAYVVEQGRQQGLSQAQVNALQTIALEYFGRQ
jgi:hypothetical protein